VNFRKLPNSGPTQNLRKTSVQLWVNLGSLWKTSEIFFPFSRCKVKVNIASSKSIWGHGGQFDGEEVSPNLISYPFYLRRHFTSKLGKPFHSTLLYNAFFQRSFLLMAPNFLALATTFENLGARWHLAKKVNFMPWPQTSLGEVVCQLLHYLLKLLHVNYILS